MKLHKLTLAIGLLMIVTLLTSTVAFSDVKLPRVISENMVLQQNAKVPVWGWAQSGEKVSVTFADQSVNTTADNDGNWSVKLKPMKVSATPRDMVIKGNNTITLKNILVGDVWLCSGQSNMQWGLWGVDNKDQEIAAANYPQIRLFTIAKKASGTPLKDLDGNWSECSPATAAGFSAVGYFFGRAIHNNLKIPIGLMDNSIGATPAEAWTSVEALDANRRLKVYADTYRKDIAAFAEGKPTSTTLPPDSIFTTTACFNAMTNPLIPFALKGTIWYQGESNIGRAGQYAELMKTMITDWRTRFNNRKMPFLVVQLANLGTPPAQPGESGWAELRDSQLSLLKFPAYGMAVAMDIGNPIDIHPANKQDVGMRLALIARKIAYGQKLVYSGPIYKSMTIEDSKIRLTFDNVGHGLVAKGGDLRLFAIAGKNRQFFWAKAKIEKNTVVVWHDLVTRPVAVRYAWMDDPEGVNFYNKDNLPASPLKTDKWKGIMQGF